MGQRAQAEVPQPGEPEGPADPWARAARIRDTVCALRSKERGVADFDVSDFGAVGDGKTPCDEAFRAAIEACSGSGGGRVVVPAGRFATGPIRLLSDVELHLTADATIAFSTDPQRYLPCVLTRFEGMELWNYSPLVYALGQRNISITGTGTLDGQADATNWWPWKGQEHYGWQPGQPAQQDARDRLFADAERGTPVEERMYGDGHLLRPSFIQPYRCENVVIEGVTIRRAPMWIIHPVLCDRVLVRDVTVISHGPNSDGCDPESCRDVVIQGCVFDTGDDCIAVKSGRNADGRRLNVPSERILVENCEFRDGHGGITIGSEISAGVREVFVRDLRMTSPALDVALRFKTNSMRGGFIEDFYARDITVDSVARSAIEVDLDYEEGAGCGFNPVIENITISDVTVRHARQAIMIKGYPDAPIHHVRLSDIDFQHTDSSNIIEHVAEFYLDNVIENGRQLHSLA
jgi:polygalacturonase